MLFYSWNRNICLLDLADRNGREFAVYAWIMDPADRLWETVLWGWDWGSHRKAWGFCSPLENMGLAEGAGRPREKFIDELY